MASDDNSERDRIRAAAALDYAIDILVVKTGLTRPQASELVNRYGTDRDMLIKQAASFALQLHR